MKRERPPKMSKQTDSIVSAQERAAKIREESARIEQEQGNAADRQREHQAALDEFARKDETARVTLAAGIAHGETRDSLLQRIRDMRENPPTLAVPVETYRSERMQKEFEAEIALGRAAVAKAEAEMAANRDRVQQEDRANELRLGTMEPVFRANEPPSAAALLGKKTGYGRT
jgi:hypothetical protein